jgi:hypothetical protein
MKRNDPLGFSEHHTEEAKSERLGKTFIASLMQQVTISSIAQEKSLRWTDQAKLEQIKENANINVPGEYKPEYDKLILKHFKIVSIGKNDLGRVKYFLHKTTRRTKNMFKESNLKSPMQTNLFCKNH